MLNIALNRRRLFPVSVAIALSMVGLCAGLEQDEVIDRSHDIKAAYLYNFGKYVTWPEGAAAEPDDHFVIGIVGDSPLSQSLTKVARQKTIAGRKIRIEKVVNVEQSHQCDLLYFPDGQNNSLFKAIARSVQGSPSLLVGDNPGFASQGGMINFYIENNKVKFEINTEQAKQSRLSISSKLLRLGRALDAPAMTQ